MRKKAGSFGTVFLGKQTKGIQRLFTQHGAPYLPRRDGDFRTDAQHQQEIFDYLMSLAAFLRQLLLLPLKNTPRQIISISPMVASRLSILATVGCETPDEQPCPPDELPHFPDQVRNQLNVIINQLAPMRSLTRRNPSTCSSTFTNCVTFFCCWRTCATTHCASSLW